MHDEMHDLGERIATGAAHLDAALHRLLSDLRRFDEGGGWSSARTCAQWLSWRVGWDLGAAREHVRVARRLGELPKLNDALHRGAISYSQVRALSRVATPDNEAQLLLYATHMTGAQLEKTCRLYRAAQQQTGATPPTRFVRRRDLDDGMVHIDLRLRPEEAAVVWAAIERATMDAHEGVATEKVSAEAPPPLGQGVATEKVSAETSGFDRCQGVMALAQAYVRGTAPDRTPIEIVVTTSADLPGAGSFTDGGVVGQEALRQLECDAARVEVQVDRTTGVPLSVGRKTRTIPPHIKRALLVRDQSKCRFPGCTHRSFLEGHHIHHWSDGGPTELNNLVSLCGACHTRVHQEGYRIELDALGQPRFLDPRGVDVPQVPPRPAVIDLEVPVATPTHECLWVGERVDYEACVEALMTGGGA